VKSPKAYVFLYAQASYRQLSRIQKSRSERLFSGMGREGFEPSTLGLRVPCSAS
jgi:hypothetical protein